MTGELLRIRRSCQPEVLAPRPPVFASQLRKTTTGNQGMETTLPYQTPPEDTKHPGPPTLEFYNTLFHTLRVCPDEIHRIPYAQIPGGTRALKTSNLHKAMRTRGERISVTSINAEHLGVMCMAADAPTSSRGRKRLPVYDGFAATMREQPNVWLELAFAVIPGRTLAIKTSGLITNLHTRGLRVMLRRIDDLSTYVRIVEDYEAGAQ